MKFNSEQIASLLRTVGQVAGGVLATNGYGTNEMWQTVFGGLLTAGLTLWSLWSNRTAGLVAKAAALPAVDAVTVKDGATARAAVKAGAPVAAINAAT